jgi:hypothetical protein
MTAATKATHTPTLEELALDYGKACQEFGEGGAPYGYCAPSWHALRERIESVESQRADLLAALQDVLRIATAASIGVSGNAPRLERARAAIAKATGGSP